VIEIAGSDVFVTFKGRILYAYTSEEVKIGDVLLVTGASAVPIHAGPVEVQIIDNESLHNNVLMDSVLDVQTGKEVLDLIEALDKLEGNYKLTIETPKGTLEAGIIGDPDFPGMYIDVRSPEGYTVNVALVEYEVSEEAMVIYVWEQDEEEVIFEGRWDK
jgi:gamma-glutamylcyclotransferase (GGCT)/AIG2-like uncharacterized protein YtfP